MKMSDYESCPSCRGSFSFNKPREDHKCPFCGYYFKDVEPDEQSTIECPWCHKLDSVLCMLNPVGVRYACEYCGLSGPVVVGCKEALVVFKRIVINS